MKLFCHLFDNSLILIKSLSRLSQYHQAFDYSAELNIFLRLGNVTVHPIFHVTDDDC